MIDMSIRRATLSLIAGALAVLAYPMQGVADLTVNQGYDLLVTQSGTNFSGVDFQGVPLGTFDFGAGPVNVGDTDTIIQRLADATVATAGLSATVAAQINALQLMSTAPTDFGLGADFYYITLQSVRGGPTTSGTITITFDPASTPSNQFGTFSSFFDVFFDIRKGSLNGPIALSSELTLTSAGNAWTHVAPTGAILIDGVNNNLNGTNNLNDFWPVGTIQEMHPGVGVHAVRAVPEPCAIGLSLMGSLCVLGYSRKRRSTSS